MHSKQPCGKTFKRVWCFLEVTPHSFQNRNLVLRIGHLVIWMAHHSRILGAENLVVSSFNPHAPSVRSLIRVMQALSQVGYP